MKTFAVLLLAHLIADFPLQTNRIFRMKLAGIYGLSLHVFIHLLVAAFLISAPWNYWPILLVLVITHFATDWTKVQIQRLDKPLLPGFIIDQIAHLLIIILMAKWQPDVASTLPMWLMWPNIFLAIFPALLMLLWVWANDQCQQKIIPVRKEVLWACRKLLPMSQRVGWMVTAVLMISGIITAV